MSDVEYIPIIDFGCFHIDNASDNIDITKETVQETSQKLCDALRNIGFVYLKNHGIRDEEILKVQGLFHSFFDLPFDVKRKFIKGGDKNHGYTAWETEKCNPSRACDLKEAFNVTPCELLETNTYPNAEVPGFENGAKEFMDRANVVARRVLQAVAIGLKLKNPSFFDDFHHAYNTGIANTTTLRVARYGALDGIEIKPNQVRCGEHSDYGSVTLVFQDGVGGLEVKGVDGDYKPATPILGTVVVNIGDLMQRWTADQLKATKHRVVVPTDESAKKRVRSSVIYFMMPDDDALIECLDGSNKYPPIAAYDWVMSQMNKIY